MVEASEGEIFGGTQRDRGPGGKIRK